VNSLSYGGGWKKKRASGICARFQMTFFTVLTATVEPFGHSTRGRYQKMTSGCIRREATEKHKVPNVPVLKRTLYITDLRPWERIGIPWEIEYTIVVRFSNTGAPNRAINLPRSVSISG